MNRVYMKLNVLGLPLHCQQQPMYLNPYSKLRSINGWTLDIFFFTFGWIRGEEMKYNEENKTNKYKLYFI